ncbi:hypothetical protein GCM10011273_18090 [Asticcacaulis endophyticus]|uniref:Uncharacterized protein n=1 Tax=Asticcacaulis endophyticus TaxID=1395890 RepID=A0A918Q3W4_9CAUL|nr:hypothetical protein GCM10011273_18090 [Asticcacaulis endophyticus]
MPSDPALALPVSQRTRQGVEGMNSGFAAFAPQFREITSPKVNQILTRLHSPVGCVFLANKQVERFAFNID